MKKEDFYRVADGIKLIGGLWLSDPDLPVEGQTEDVQPCCKNKTRFAVPHAFKKGKTIFFVGCAVCDNMHMWPKFSGR
jgi:hypothetical protein